MNSSSDRRYSFVRSIALVVVCLAGTAVLSSDASADCPVPAACNSLCSANNGVAVCDFRNQSPGGPVTAYIVEDYDTTNSGYEAFGTYYPAGSAVAFCCDEELPDDANNEIDTVTLYGDDDADHLYFNYQVGEAEYNLQPADDDELDGYIYGGDNSDVISGSNYTGADYTDWLYGEYGDDTVHGNGGADMIYGGDNEDTLLGEGGADFIHGGDHLDRISGGADDDYIFGEGGKDYISGGGGDDWIDGGEGGDIMCGGPGDGDYITDGDSVEELYPDKLYGAEVGDTSACTAGTHSRSDPFSGSGCDEDMMFAPPECP